MEDIQSQTVISNWQPPIPRPRNPGRLFLVSPIPEEILERRRRRKETVEQAGVAVMSAALVWLVVGA